MNKISGHYLSSIIDACISLGLSKDLIFDKVKIPRPDPSNPLQRYESDCLLDLYELASRELNEPNIGLKVGEKFNVSWVNETSKLLPYCANLGETALMLARYHRLTQSCGQTHIRLGADSALEWQSNYDDFEKYRHVIEVIFIGIVLGTKWLLWNEGNPVKYVHFKHSLRGNKAAYEDLFGCDVEFGRDVDAIGTKKEYFSIPLVTSNPEMKMEMCRKLDRILLRLSDETALIARVEASIRVQLQEVRPKFSTTANHLGVNERRLRYKLKRQSTSFREMVDSVRREICEFEMLKHTQLSLIAQKLCFHDQSAFNHAFHKWYGLSPREYQANHSAARGAK